MECPLIALSCLSSVELTTHSDRILCLPLPIVGGEDEQSTDFVSWSNVNDNIYITCYAIYPKSTSQLVFVMDGVE